MTFPPCYEDIIELALPDGDLLHSDDTDAFTSKLGGRAVWLQAPSKYLLDSLKCPKCNTELYLLLQMDCPREEYPLVDRVVYIFVCNTRACSQHPRGWRVIFMMKHSAAAVQASVQEARASFWDSLMNNDETPEAMKEIIPSTLNVAATKSSATLHNPKNKFPGIYLHIDEEIIVEKGMEEQLYKTIRVVDEDALMAALYNDELTEAEIDLMYPQKIVWALVMNKR